MPVPSFGCMICRQRRIKCDERAGACLRCERAHVNCPGYQNPFDVLLRPSTLQPSARDFSANLSRVQSAQSQRSASTLVPENPQAPAATVLRQPAIDLEEITLGAYYASYCVSASTLCSAEYVRQQGNGCLSATIHLLGLMQLNQLHGLPSGVNTIFKQYANATSLLNAALASPEHLVRDSTLLATLLLGIAEMKASPDFTLRYWLMHTRGAAALVESRGTDQVRSRVGSALFLQTSTQISTYCILGKEHIPCELQSLRVKLQEHVVDIDHPLWQWHGLMIRFVNLHATTCKMSLEIRTIQAQAIINEALSINRDMRIVLETAGDEWQYQTQPSDAFAPLVCYEHHYRTLLSARVWKERRTAIILLFSIVLETAKLYNGHRGLEVVSQKYVEHAHSAIQTAAIDTIAAVPQMLAGLLTKASGIRSPRSDEGLRLCDSHSEYDELVFRQMQPDARLLPYMDSCRVQWPIYFAVQCEHVEPQIRLQLLHILEDAGRSMQIQQWQILAKSVREGFETSNDLLLQAASIASV